MNTETRTLPGDPDTTISGPTRFLDTLFEGTEETQPGPPFFDDTLNYLQSQYNKVTSDVGAATKKRFKLDDQIETMEQERATVQALLIEEYRKRHPRDPETGEAVPAPFGATEEERP